MGQRGAVVTGIGAVTPFGTSLADLAARFAAGDRSIAPGSDGASLAIERVPVEAVPEAGRSRVGRMDRLCQLLMVASHLAVEDAGLALAGEDAARVGLSFGTALGCLVTDAEYNQAIVVGGPAAASPRLFAYTVSSAAAGEVSIALGIKGPNTTMHFGLAAGLGAVGYATDLIETGKADVVLAAGADVIGPPIVGALRDMALLKRREDTTPFRDSGPGLFPAEAAVVVVLEGEERARRRGARCRGRIEGWTAGFEPTLAGRAPETTGVVAAIRRALARSGRDLDATAVVFTSAHGTPLDEVERAAIEYVFAADESTLLVAPKGVVGDAFGASGVLALALAAVLLERQPECASGVAIDLAGRPQTGDTLRRRLASTQAVLVDALCYSGNVVALVLGRMATPTAASMQ
jgi:3-oxoacyl-[acyl-carrier-protein] synthase II